MKRAVAGLAFLCAVLLAPPAQATLVNVDLSGAATGTFIDGGGADFAGTFSGQSIVGGTGISGSPLGPLTLAPANQLTVAFFGGSNSILPVPGNQGPLSVLLDSNADAVSWTMGFANTPSTVTIGFFGSNGVLVNSVLQPLISGYNAYSFSGFGTFSGFTIYDNNDAAGLRYQDFAYNSVSDVPEPTTMLLLSLGLGGLALRRRA